MKIKYVTVFADKQLAHSMEDYLAALKSAAATREYYQVTKISHTGEASQKCYLCCLYFVCLL